MTARAVCMMAVFALALLASAALAFWLSAEIHLWRTLKSLTFESVATNGSYVYWLEFGYGYVDLDFASRGPSGKTEVQSFHMHY